MIKILVIICLNIFIYLKTMRYFFKSCKDFFELLMNCLNEKKKLSYYINQASLLLIYIIKLTILCKINGLSYFNTYIFLFEEIFYKRNTHRKI